jgi:hypothetical protein
MDKILFRKKVSNFIIALSKLNFNNFFFNATTGEPILFSKIFPPGNYFLVANSNCIFDKKNGYKINISDFVIRFSDFKTKGYEDYIGNKTSLWVTNSSISVPNLPIPFIYISNNENTFPDKQIEIISKYGDILPSFIILHNNYLINLTKKLLGFIPEIELFTLLLLSSKYKKINTFGYNFNYYMNKYHYCYDNLGPSNKYNINLNTDIYNYLSNINFFIDTNRKIKIVKKEKKQSKKFAGRLPKHIQLLEKEKEIFSTHSNKKNIKDSKIVNDTNKKLVSLVNFIEKYPDT